MCRGHEVNVAPCYLSAHREPIPVMAIPPAVAAARIEERAVAVAARVPEDALGLVHGEPELMMPVMMRVREVQVHT